MQTNKNLTTTAPPLLLAADTAGRACDYMRRAVWIDPVEVYDEITEPLEATSDPPAKTSQVDASNQLPAPSPRAVGVGAVLRSRYVLEEVLGQGGDSVVFRARDLHRSPNEEPDGCVAIKLLLPERRHDPNALARLKREFRQTQRLAHPGIVRVFDLDSDGDIWFISMELIHGQTINTWLRESRSFEQCVNLLGACCDALEHAHSRGIIHADLKPSNVLVARDGGVKLIDFGCATSADRRTDGGQGSSAIATASYASPQVLKGAVADERDDIFSLACLSYVILSNGRSPFGGKSALEASRSSVQPLPIGAIPARLGAVVMRGLALERELRPGSVREFHAELSSVDLSTSRTDLIATIPVKVPRPRGGAMYWLAQHRSILASLILILMGAVALGWQVQQHSTDRPGIVAQVIPAKSEPTPMPAPTLPVQSAVQPPPPAPPPLGDVKPVPQATGKISFESPAIHVVDAQSLVAIPVKRLNSTRGPGSVAWVIEKDSARPDVDHASLGWNIIKFIEGQSVRSIFIPLIGSASSDIAGRPRIFVVALKRVRGGPALGPISRITVTISRAGSDIDQRSAQMDGGGR